MSYRLRSAQEDLAFLRTIVDSAPTLQRATGQVFFASGALYGTECLFHGARAMGWLTAPDAVSVAVSAAATVGFFAALITIARRNPPATGAIQRGIDAAFSAVGMANLTFLAIFVLAATRQRDLTVWLFYPVATFVLQGTAWLVAFRLLRQRWLGAVAVAWFAAAIALESLRTSPLYPLFAAACLYGLLGGTGLYLMRGRRDVRL